MLVPLLLNNLLGSSASAVTTGTAVSGLTEAQIVAGGETIIITLTGDTWVAAGTGPIGSIADTQALIDGISAAESETTGWNAEVRDKEVVGSVVRTSNTVVTITLSAAAYDVTANETISILVPAATLTGAQVIGSSPGITVTADVVVSAVRGGGRSRRRPVKLPDGRYTFADNPEIKRLLEFYKVDQETLVEEFKEPPSRRQMKRIKNKAIPAPQIIEELEEDADIQFVLNEIAKALS